MLLAACALAAGLLLGCKTDSSKTPVIGTAFAGPIKLNLREEISPASKNIATAKHGEKLEILQIRRRFVRVRTPDGKEGWTDSRNLLSSKQMAELADLADRSKKLPAQGQASVYGLLNMHPEPTRGSTTFYQIQEGMKVDVLAHKLSPKTSPPPNPANNLDLKKAPPRPTKKKKEPEYPPPARPAAPGLPPNWVELSKTRMEEPPPPEPVEPLDPKAKKKKRPRPRPGGPPMEDWTLVRTSDGKAGWVLSRMLVMAIPDEVAQYAEGARITSYFPLAEVNDEGQIKHHWLWTTIREDNVPYEFDSFRVFTYVVKRHRYETAYIERNVEGYYPIQASPGAMPKFSLILREADGKLYKKTWIMEGYMVRKIADEPYSPKASDAPETKSDGIADKLRSLLDGS
ncbi:MAG TPA: SH3 domain-containing protein [Bryobacteraceae bacterium]|nr:SH3 domain-containing protein [Bryobacteraceae bacterium]